MGEAIYLKKFNENISSCFLLSGTKLPLHPKPKSTQVNLDEEYKMKLVCILTFLANATKLPPSLFTLMLGFLLEEFRPAIMLQLWHSGLQPIVQEYFLYKDYEISSKWKYVNSCS